MNVSSLISRLKKLDIRIELVDNQLKLNAPEGALTPGIIDELKEKKKELIEFLRESFQNRLEYASINPSEKKEYYILSSVQKRLYILQQMVPGNISYNLPNVFSLQGEIDVKKLDITFKRLVHRHESLRTSFETIDDEQVQRIHEEVEFGVRYDEVEGEIETGINNFIRPFDLSGAPLLRVGLITLSRENHLLLFDMHHIITDAASIDVLIKDFTVFYQGGDLPAIRIRYKDFSEWQYNRKNSKEMKQQEAFWLKEFEGEIPVLDLPLDYVRPAGPGFEGSIITSDFDSRISGALKAHVRREGTTLNMFLLALTYIFLAKLSGLEDIVIGIPAANRGHADLQDIIGMFVNTLPLRNFTAGGKNSRGFSREIKERTLRALENREYPLEDLVDRVLAERDAGRSPLFDVMFVFQETRGRVVDIPGLKMTLREYDSKTAKFDLIIFAAEIDDRIGLKFEYNTRLFKEKTVERFIDYFKTMAVNVLDNPGMRISQIDILPGEERRRLIYDFNNTASEKVFPGTETIHGLFEAQAGRTPGSIAAAGTEHGPRSTTFISYKKLSEDSHRLAGLLRKRGVAGGAVAAVLMERSIDMAAALIAVLKAGGAYLPIDPDWPEERILYMLEDSGAQFILVDRRAREKIPFTALRGLENNRDIKIEVTAPRGHIKEFDRLPRPDRSLIDLRNYRNKIGMASVTGCISLQATRGCPYHCLFCHKIWSKHHVYRSPENIYNEIAYYYRKGVTNFAFIDDCFNLDGEKSSRVFQLMVKNKLQVRLFFPNGLRGDIMTPDYIDLMVEAGTRGINLSLESASPRLQKLLKKYLHLDKFKEVMDYIASRHPNVILEVATMHGFPSESEAEAMMTLEFIKGIRWLHFPYIHILKIFPNTEMEAFALEQGISRQDIMKSRDRAFHELPETLPFPASFTRQYQSEFLNEYFLNKERLKKVLPVQMEILSEGALAQKYNAYLPVEIKTIEDIIEFAQLEDLPIPADYRERKDGGAAIFQRGPERPAGKPGAKKILLLDLSQHFSSHRMMYRVVEQPLGLISLLTYLKERFGDKIDGRVYKSGNDFDSFAELKVLVDAYQPHLVGVRTLTFFKEFFHETLSQLRQWGVDAPIITGGPYASSDYDTILKDKNINLAVLGEGEYTLGELIENMLENDFKLPGAGVLQNIPGIAFVRDAGGPRRSREVVPLHRSIQAADSEDPLNAFPPAAGNNPAYVMYTSGSTGKPKGVMVEHRQVNNCISWMQDKFRLTARDVILQRTALTFDPSVWEIFWPLYVGARFKVLGEHERKDADFLLGLMAEDSDLTMMYCPSTLINAMVYLLEAKPVKPRLRIPRLIIGAEPIRRETVNKFYTYYPGRIVNTYGPNECTINNTYCDLGPGDKRPTVPIGKPVANNRIYILSADSRVQPPGITGEICIAGDSVSRGYINNPVKTAQSFIANPFGPGKLYKTGDTGRRLEDGTIEITGRKDEQVKIRGYRIEPAEIRASLLKHPSIDDGIVMVKKIGEAGKKTGTCKKCGITADYPNVTVDGEGYCGICRDYPRTKKYIDAYFKTPDRLWEAIAKRNQDKTAAYDCLLLYSGGKGSAYALYRLVDRGFKVLAFTYNNGYFSKSHLRNIKKITAELGVDHIEATHKNSDQIMRESLKTISTVCRGCFHTSFSLAAEYAYKNDINLVIGATLSRGQIIENKLLMHFQQGITGTAELEEEILKIQKMTPQLDKDIFEYIGIDVVDNGAVHDRVKFLDFYRYCDITNEEMISYLNNRDPYWKTGKSHAVYSTNCPIKQMGDYGHLVEKGYHYYGAATVWEKRLGHLAAGDLKKDLQNHVTEKGYGNFLKRVGYVPRSRDRKESKLEKSDYHLCAYYVPSGESPDSVELREYLAGTLPLYMVPTLFVKIAEIPLTSNGKVDRKALPEPELKNIKKTGAAGRSAYKAPVSEVEVRLAKIWGEVLFDGSYTSIGIDDNFFHLGGESLKSTILMSRIRKVFDVKISLVDIFQLPTIRDMAAYIEKERKETKGAGSIFSVPIAPVEKRDYYMPSSAQERLYVLQQMDQQGTGYNIPFVSALEGGVCIGKLEETIKGLIERHESLRTSFGPVENRPVQRIHGAVEFGLDFADSITHFIRPFDLSHAPLFRVGLLEQERNKYTLMVDMHHIISDGTSMGILVREFMALYAGKESTEPRIQYKDFSRWQKNCKVKKSIKQQEEYWLKELAGEVPVLNLPLDYSRPVVQSFEGNTISFQVDKEETQLLKKVALKEDTTLYMVLLSLYTVFLSKIANQEDIVVGTAVAGRGHADLEEIIGMFVNALALRNFPLGEKSYRRFLVEVKERTLEAFAHQDYPFEDLVEALDVERNTGRNPVFDTMFVLQNFNIPDIGIPGLTLKPREYEHKISKFDLTLQVLESEDMLSCTFEYCTKLFRRETIQRFIQYFDKIISTVRENRDIRISGIEIINEEEKNRLLYTFNDTRVEYPHDKTIQRLFAEQAARMGDRVAVIGTAQSAERMASVSYKELNKKSNRLAHILTGKGVKPDIIVGIKMERSIEMIIGILGILKAGGAYLPIDPQYPEGRINYMLKDSGADILLTALEIAGFSSPRAINNRPKGTPVTSLAYIIYTSGTTGRPKGVLVKHQGLVNMIYAHRKVFAENPDSRISQVASPAFDAMAFEVWPCLSKGAALYIADDESRLDPAEMQRWLIEKQITISFQPTAIVEQLLDKKWPDRGVALKALRTAGDRLARNPTRPYPFTLYNLYGPTEDTVWTTWTEVNVEPDPRGFPPIGKPVDNHRVYIISPGGQLQPIGIPGQLCIAGEGLAKGYLNQPELTAERFIHPSPFTLHPSPIYQTGDLARWLPDGNIQFIGRIDSQLKIRGYRIELGEIENQLLTHGKIKEAIVLAGEDHNDKYLCGYIAAKPGETNPIDGSGLREYLSQRLPDYMVPSYFVQLDKIPLTPNGKVDRKALPAPGIERGKSYVAPRDDTEKKLLDIWSGILDVEKEKIGIDANFFHLGGHSLKAAVLVSRIHKELNINVPLTGIFKTPHIRGLAAYIKKTARSKPIPVQPVEKKEYYPLSSAQRRLYILHRMDAEKGITYNMPSVWCLEGQLDEKKMAGVFHRLIRRHESLRTFFTVVNDEPVQRVHGESAIGHWTLVSGEAGKSEIEDIIKNFIKTFDLSRAPLLRVELIKVDEQTHILMVDMHHIISDGLSIGIFVKEFTELYAGKKLPGLKLQYKDYGEWHNRPAEREFIKKQQTYWLKEFAGELPVLNLPMDYPRPLVQSFAGRTLHFEINKEETAALKSLAREQDVTLFMLLLSLYTVFLSKLSGREDIVVGTPIAGRGHTDMAGIVGMFVNTLALRNFPLLEKTFAQFLGEIKKNTIKAFENQDYLYEDLLEQVEVERDTGRNPLFDIMFVLQNMETPVVRIPGLKVVPYPHESRTAKFDLTLTAVEIEDRLAFTFEYCTGLFKKETIRRFTAFFKKAVSTVLENYETRISGIEIITGEEKNRILHDFNDTGAEYPRDKTIHRLFEEQAARMGDRVAVIGTAHSAQRMASVSYKELNNQSNRLAHILTGKGVEPDIIVGIKVGRSVEMIIGILGILKAGGAYLPIDPDYPRERIDYMLADSGAKLLITADSLLLPFSPSPLPSSHPPPAPVTRLAYVIYTSGSTGKPKGVLIQHRSLVNRLNWMQRFYPLGKGDVILQKTTFTFDVSVWELLWWGIAGAGVYLLKPGDEKDPGAIVREIEKQCITTIHFVPSMLKTFLDYINDSAAGVLSCKTLRRVFASGEALSIARVEQFNRRLNEENGARLINLYGPTEATIDVSYFNCTGIKTAGETPKTIPIGKPIENTWLYILDRNMALQPVGLKGELFIGGDALAKGYLNKPGLTAEKFIHPSPFTLHPSPIYQTGDLARWMPDGNIEFLGRIDHQVKIRGYRIELGEIENRLLTHGKVKEAIVLAREDNDDTNLCAYLVASPGETGSIDQYQLREYLSNRLPDYMVPSYFVQLDKIPLTPNGKVDRKALPVPGIEMGKNYVAPRDDIEKKLADIWSEILDVEKGKIGINDNFFHLGGHSLKATVLSSRIHKEFNVNVPITGIFKTPHIHGLAAYIKEAARSNYIPVEPGEKKEYYPLSSAQRRLYILQQMAEQGIGYNMPSAWRLEGNLDDEKLGATFHRLIRRHESLRTSFTVVNDEPVQRVHEEAVIDHWSLVIGEAGKREIENIIKNFIKPFDLSRGPLLRVDLIKVNEQRYILMVDMHHIISDGLSIGIFVKEFTELYAGNELPRLRLQYKDGAAWHNRQAEREFIKEQRVYWLKQFEREAAVLELPNDYPRPTVQNFAGESLHFEINKEETAALKSLAREQEVTLFMLLLSLYTVFLSKLSGREDIVVGTPIAGRGHTDMEDIIGMFVNTLALRNFPVVEKTFAQFLGEVRKNTVKAFENQDYLYEDLLEQVEVERDTGRNPLFDIMFVLQNMDTPVARVPGLKVVPYPYESRISKFDLTLTAVEIEDRLAFTFEYCTGLFKKETIRRFTGFFKKTVSSILQGYETRMSGIEIISKKEKRRLLQDFNDTETAYPGKKTIPQLFEEQVKQRPDRIAAVGLTLLTAAQILSNGSKTIAFSYKELNRRSDQLAYLLKEKGVATDTIVGIMVGPSLEMLIGILGILKAGSAYLPIDPGYPAGRINYMLADSNAGILLATVKLQGKVKSEVEENSRKPRQLPLQFINFETELAPAFEPPLSTQATPTNLAYVIYTSGSTGKPKGVLLTHQNLVNYVHWFKGTAGITPRDRALLTSSFSFDLGYTCIYPPILSGACLHIICRETYLSPQLLLNYILRDGITYLKVTPSLFSAIVTDPGYSLSTCRHLRLVVMGGEPIKPGDVEKAHHIQPHLEIINHYGPTEATIGCIAYSIDFSRFEEYKLRPFIGKPINNTGIYILTQCGIVTPVGIPGELCISGICLARGYLNKPGLTAERFVHPSPFTPHFSPIYKTGDLARWLVDSNIEFLGRIDHQVKIRGFRIELEEIENQLLTHGKVKEAILITRENKNDKYLCAYIVAKSIETKLIDQPGLREYLSNRLPDYMVPSYFVQLDNIPLTPNGKLDRKALPEPGMQAGENYIAPRNEIEKKLVGIWSEILELEKEKISIDDNFFHLGGHSLKGIILAGEIHKLLNLKIPLAKLFKNPTIKALSGFIKKLEEDKFENIEAAEKKEYYSISYAQKRIYTAHQLEPGSTSYNIASILRLIGELDRAHFQDTFRKLIERHESLRTSFDIIGNKPIQKIHDKVEFSIQYCGLGEGAADLKKYIRAFDITRAPLLRVYLMRTGEREHAMMADISHIVSDGVSSWVFAKDFMELYNRQELSPINIRYKDFSEWENRLFRTGKIKKQEEFWLKEFEDEIPPLNLPSDYPGPDVRSVEAGDTISIVLEEPSKGKIDHIIRETGTTLFTFLLAVYNVLLNKYTGKEDIVVGSVVTGRTHVDLENVIGVFINMLPLRNRPRSDKSFKDFLEEVKENALQAFENQEYPLEELVEKLEIRSKPGRHPLFDTEFALNNIDEEEIEIPGLRMERYDSGINFAKFDLHFLAIEHNNSINIVLRYSTQLFSRTTAEKIIEHFVEITGKILKNPGIKLEDIDITIDFAPIQLSSLENEQGDFNF